MQKSIFFILFVLTSCLSFGQIKRYTLTGSLLDENNQAIIGASIVALNPIDSVMLAFGSSDNDGKFTIKNVKPQDIKLQITYIGYGTIEKAMKVEGSTAIIDVGTITMVTDENLLKEVVVKGEYVPIKVTKDTVEYNADAFRVRPNANVEELLKKLPGVEVDANGTVTAQGEQVVRVTVDGKRFFGNDVKMATQNLPADAVKKIQFIDKKSEKAEFSGISDGETEKVMNLQLRDNKKVGTFGDVTAGYGTQERFDSKVSINKFNSKYQLSTLGNFNNLSNQGFNFSDYNTLMGGSGFSNGGSGGTSASRDIVNFGGGNQGRIKSGTLGANTFYEFSKKLSGSLSYFYTNSNQDLVKDKSTQNFLVENNFITDESTSTINKRNGNTFNLNLQAKPDSFHRIDIESSLRLNNTNVKNKSLVSNLTQIGEIVNNNNQSDTTATNLQDLTFRAVLNKRLRKPGRIFTLETSYGTTENENDYDIYSERSTFGNISNLRTLIQDQISLNDNKNYRVYTEYKEPLGNGNYLGVSYTNRNYNADQDKLFYDIDRNTGVRSANDLLSSIFRTDILFNRAALLYTKDAESYAFTADLGFQNSRLKGDNLLLSSNPINNKFNYFIPALTFNWTDKNLRFRYNTSVSEPSVSQLQPIADNSNPLNVYQGNANLKPEYSHTFNVRYNFFDNFNFRNFFAFLNVRLTENKIVNAVKILPGFIRETSPINTESGKNISLNFSYSSPIRPIKLKTRVFGGGGINQSINFINSIQNDVNTLTPRIGVELENLNNSVVSIMGGYDVNYSQNRYSISTTQNNNFLTQNLRSVVVVNMGKGFTFDGDINHAIYSKEQFGDENTLTLANAAFGKRFFNDRITAKLRIADIFNVGQGISRTASDTALEEVTTNAIGRFTMLSLTYRLSAFNPQSSMSTGGMRMRDRG